MVTRSSLWYKRLGRAIIATVKTSWTGRPRALPVTRRGLLGRTLALGALAIAGCRVVPGTSPPPPALTVLAPAHPVAAVQGLIATQIAAAAREVGARASSQSLSAATLRAKLRAAISAGQPPDLAVVGVADSAPLAAAGQLRDTGGTLARIVGLDGELFGPLGALAGTGAFVDRAADHPSPIWAIPYLSLGGAWLVRQDLLASKGLPTPKTFADMRATAEQLTSAGGAIFGWGAPLPVGAAVDDLTRLTLLAHGASLFDSYGLEVTLDPADAAAGLQAFAELGQSNTGTPLAPSGIVDWSPEQLTEAFASGQLAQTIDLGGLYANVVTRQPALRAAITALPPPSGPNGWFTSAPTSFVIVPGRGKAVDHALALIERLLRPERYAALVRAGQGSVIPPYAYLTKDPFWDDDPNYPVFAANARGDPARNFQYAPPGYPAPPTLPAAVVQQSNALANALRSVVLGETPPAAAANALADQCRALAKQALALQPAPGPTPEPFWLRALGA